MVKLFFFLSKKNINTSEENNNNQLIDTQSSAINFNQDKYRMDSKTNGTMRKENNKTVEEKKEIKNKLENSSVNTLGVVPYDKEFLKDFVNKVVKEKIDINNKEEVNKQAANVLNQLKKLNNGALASFNINKTKNINDSNEQKTKNNNLVNSSKTSLLKETSSNTKDNSLLRPLQNNTNSSKVSNSASKSKYFYSKPSASYLLSASLSKTAKASTSYSKSSNKSKLPLNRSNLRKSLRSSNSKIGQLKQDFIEETNNEEFQEKSKINENKPILHDSTKLNNELNSTNNNINKKEYNNPKEVLLNNNKKTNKETLDQKKENNNKINKENNNITKLDKSNNNDEINNQQIDIINNDNNDDSLSTSSTLTSELINSLIDGTKDEDSDKIHLTENIDLTKNIENGMVKDIPTKNNSFSPSENEILNEIDDNNDKKNKNINKDKYNKEFNDTNDVDYMDIDIKLNKNNENKSFNKEKSPPKKISSLKTSKRKSITSPSSIRNKNKLINKFENADMEINIDNNENNLREKEKDDIIIEEIKNDDKQYIDTEDESDKKIKYRYK